MTKIILLICPDGLAIQRGCHQKDDYAAKSKLTFHKVPAKGTFGDTITYFQHLSSIFNSDFWLFPTKIIKLASQINLKGRTVTTQNQSILSVHSPVTTGLARVHLNLDSSTEASKDKRCSTHSGVHTLQPIQQSEFAWL
jgi:hypothetical protein